MSIANLRLADSITCHAWNNNCSEVAICPNNNQVQIFKRNGTQFDPEPLHILDEHDQVVSGIDWAPKTNRLLTSAHDRNAYVWRFEQNVWKPTLVILRINRAATHCKWSPNENKFAVASGAKVVSVCYFEVDNDWWVSKHIKKHKSTVLKVDWHPNNILLATASSDFKARVFSGFIKGVDERPGETPFGSRLPFGELLAEYPSNGWVHSVKWAPSGMQLAFCSHDSTVSFVDVSGGAPGQLQSVKFNGLPVVDILWLNEDALVGIGFDNNPLLFSRNGGTWSFTKRLDEAKKEAAAAGANRAAFNMFKAKVEVGAESNVTNLNTLHQNLPNCLKSMNPGASVREFSSSGLDGIVSVWKN
mmetsp:Transcript_49632/g.124796  ORF Transcript_49632/g.124796 Transcript_49632/m.124796 type:complete len:359 (-) Transcript_49632:251-1327(-)|eukprot:CAMPEP_0177658276 /NCGR_PEP_ID=MMETSP0447-20121125/16709_1 /TAXON_ID=0 /ORGANISM="Stygamoeba regulata, Strain BSH-02190019" /LENGTH=358 /DNA_ID=CAMNT_0019162841 /DNA_START=104 /DNA_END=1180 /DNA_ORIENTATION=+